MSADRESAFISLYVLFTISIAISIWTLYLLAKHATFQSIFSQLLVYLHVSLFLDQILSLPFIYNTNSYLCSTAACLQYYVCLMNVVCVGLIVFTHHCTIFAIDTGNLSNDMTIEDNTSVSSNACSRLIAMCCCQWRLNLSKLRKQMRQYCHWIVFGFPLIALLPLTTNAYNDINTSVPWCIMMSYHQQYWVLGIFFVWLWLILLLCLLSYLYAVIQFALTKNWMLMRKFTSTVGLYAIISIAIWICRCYKRVESLIAPSSAGITFDSMLTIIIPIYIASILYGIIFLFEYRTLFRFEQSNYEQDIDVENFDITSGTTSTGSKKRSPFVRGSKGMNSDSSSGSNTRSNRSGPLGPCFEWEADELMDLLNEIAAGTVTTSDGRTMSQPGPDAMRVLRSKSTFKDTRGSKEERPTGDISLTATDNPIRSAKTIQ